MDALGDRVLELGPKPDASAPYRHFKLTRDDDGIAWLLFDRAGVSANTLSAEVIEELDSVLAALENQRAVRACHSLRETVRLRRRRRRQRISWRQRSQPVETAIGRAHAVIDRLEALKVPTVAVIHGFCLGGGLEVALACQSRIAIDGARFGFPEVMLGLHPGLGGPARFTRLVKPDAGDDPDAEPARPSMRARQKSLASSMPWRRSGMFAMPSGMRCSAA